MFWHSRPLSLFSAISYIYISHSQFLAFHNHISKPLLGNAWPFAFCGHCWSCHLPSTMKSNWQGWGPSRTIFIFQAMSQAMSAIAEILAMFPVVRHFVYTVVQPRGHCPAECYALLAMAMAIDQVHDGDQAGVTTRASLLAAMEGHWSFCRSLWHTINQKVALDAPLARFLGQAWSLAKLLCFRKDTQAHWCFGKQLAEPKPLWTASLEPSSSQGDQLPGPAQSVSRRCLPSESQRCFKESAGQLELVPGDTCWPSLELTFCQSKGSHLQFRRCGIVPCWQPCAPTLASCWNQAPVWFPRPCHNFGQCMGFATIFPKKAIRYLHCIHKHGVHSRRRHLGTSDLEQKWHRSQSALALPNLQQRFVRKLSYWLAAFFCQMAMHKLKHEYKNHVLCHVKVACNLP